MILDQVSRMPLSELRRLLWPCFAVALLLPEQQGEAEPSTAPTSPDIQSVVVSPPRCEADSFPLVAFLDSLRVELAGRGLLCCALAEPGDGAPTVASLRVTIDPIIHCATDRVQIAVQGPDGATLVEREISLADVAEAARPRALALAVAELIRSIGQAKRDDKATAVSSKPTPPPSSPSPPPVVTRAPVLSMHLEAEARDLPTRNTVLWGGEHGSPLIGTLSTRISTWVPTTPTLGSSLVALFWRAPVSGLVSVRGSLRGLPSSTSVYVPSGAGRGYMASLRFRTYKPGRARGCSLARVSGVG